jgi:hypothetical protein
MNKQTKSKTNKAVKNNKNDTAIQEIKEEKPKRQSKGTNKTPTDKLENKNDKHVKNIEDDVVDDIDDDLIEDANELKVVKSAKQPKQKIKTPNNKLENKNDKHVKNIEDDVIDDIDDDVIAEETKVAKSSKTKTTTKNNKLEEGKEPPKKINDDARKSRGMAQKIFLILTHEYDKSILERKYEVMGTTGNVYTVTIKNSPACTCPDYIQRHKRCKHIYFVLTRIMKVKKDQEDIAKYTDGDLADMFTNIPAITENLRVDAAKLAKFKTFQKNANGEIKREITEDDLCPICLGELLVCVEEITFCKKSCGYSIHKQCFDMYNSKRIDIKCLFCHKDWNMDDGNQYLNLD